MRMRRRYEPLMRVAVVNEVSASARNADILRALDGLGIEALNAGMRSPDQQPGLTYIHTGLMAALLLNTGAADLVIGGCGTGQGFLNSAMQYPGVFCGLIAEPLDAWLFSRINNGNCVSLALNKGYGWAGDINLRHIFEKLFAGDRGLGYPENRSDSQRESRAALARISAATHRPMTEILSRLSPDMTAPLAGTASFMDAVRACGADGELKSLLLSLAR